MTISIIFKLALRNIYRHKGKNLLVAIVIIFSTILFFLSSSLAWNARFAWRDYFATTFLGRYHITAFEGLERDYTIPAMKYPQKFISGSVTSYLDHHNLPWSKRIKLGAAVYNDQSGTFENFLVTLIGIDFAKELNHLTNLEIIEGTRDPLVENGVLIWHELATALNKKIGDELTLFIKDVEDNAYPYTFIITGILSQRKSAGLEGKGIMMIFPLIFADYRFVAQKTGCEDKIIEIALWDADKDNLNYLQKITDNEGLQLYPAEKGFGALYGIVDFINFIGLCLEIFVLVILIVAGLNVNMMIYFERQQEIGTMLAIGMKPSQILTLLLTELIVFATLVYAAATVLYGVLTVILPGGFSLGKFSTLFAGSNVYINLVPSSISIGYGIITCTILLSAIYPLYLSTRINPVEVFREMHL